MRVRQSSKDVCVSLFTGKPLTWSVDVVWTAVSAGLVVHVDGGSFDSLDGFQLTDAGTTVAQDELFKREATRRAKRYAARSRAAEMRGLGMVRTAYGWE